MRSHRAIAVAAILIAAFGVTLVSFSRPSAEGIAGGVKSPNRDVSQARGTGALPTQKIHDMTVVFLRAIDGAVMSITRACSPNQSLLNISKKSPP